MNNCAKTYYTDKFCCSKQGEQFRANLLAREMPLVLSNDYNKPRNQPDSGTYTFTPQVRKYLWCGSVPDNNQQGLPCNWNQGFRQ